MSFLRFSATERLFSHRARWDNSRLGHMFPETAKSARYRPSPRGRRSTELDRRWNRLAGVRCSQHDRRRHAACRPALPVCLPFHDPLKPSAAGDDRARRILAQRRVVLPGAAWAPEHVNDISNVTLYWGSTEGFRVRRGCNACFLPDVDVRSQCRSLPRHKTISGR